MASTDRRMDANEGRLSRLETGGGISETMNARPSTARLALADVSPNIQPVGATTPAFMKRAMAGSPLKRNFTAAIEGSEGLLYLKRRRLLEDEALSDVHLYREPPLKKVPLGGQVDTALDNVSPIERAPSPTEPNTPSECDDAVEGSSAERKSFSSLINYDPSSQLSCPSSNGVSNAEMLRLRLRVAMFKVRTDQIESSFADLKDEAQTRDLARRKAIEKAVAELRKEAEEVLARAPCESSSGPPLPSASPSTIRNNVTCSHAHWPRSIATSQSPEKFPLALQTITPARPTLWDTSTPPHSCPRLSRPPEPELTSSVVKGRVAEGLLGLRNAI